MNSELRELIVSKRESLGMTIEELALAASCSLAELKGFEQGLFILGKVRIASLLNALQITRQDLVTKIGQEAAEYLQL